jgi:hypothetical protein
MASQMRWLVCQKPIRTIQALRGSQGQRTGACARELRVKSRNGCVIPALDGAAVDTQQGGGIKPDPARACHVGYAVGHPKCPGRDGYLQRAPVHCRCMFCKMHCADVWLPAVQAAPHPWLCSCCCCTLVRGSAEMAQSALPHMSFLTPAAMHACCRESHEERSLNVGKALMHGGRCKSPLSSPTGS